MAIIQMKNVLIKGRGLNRLASSKIISSFKRKNNIYIIESAKKLGGLLQSIENKEGDFDIGTHFLKKTGNKHLDDLLHPQIKKKWINLNYLNSGSF